jgi:hypothetical protein
MRSLKMETSSSLLSPSGMMSTRSARATANHPRERSQKFFEQPVTGSAQKAFLEAS